MRPIIDHIRIFPISIVLVLFLIGSLANSLIAQEPVISIKDVAIQVSIDPFSNVYLIDENLEYKRYNGDGEFEWNYTDLELSEFSEISSNHPFKSMIYYPEYELIRVFGNKLQMLAELNLTNFGLGEVTAVGPSLGYQSFWIFDATTQQLSKIKQNYEVEIDGVDLTPILDQQIFPSIIKEREGWVYVYDKETGLYIFDNFGTYSTMIPITNIISFSVFKERIFYSKDNKLFEALKLTKESVELDVEVGKVLDMAFRKLLVGTEKGIDIYQF